MKKFWKIKWENIMVIELFITMIRCWLFYGEFVEDTRALAIAINCNHLKQQQYEKEYFKIRDIGNDDSGGCLLLKGQRHRGKSEWCN